MTEAGGEHQRRDLPRIYVASLADYNAGRLHGAWLEAARDDTELAEDVRAMLASSPEPFAEEYAIHDYEGFGPLQLGEYERLDRIAALARGIVEHGEAFAAWVSLDQDPAIDRFEACFRGTWPSLSEYADDLLGDLGADEFMTTVPDWLRPYVRLDSAALARDLVLGGDIAALEGTTGVHIFDLNY